MGTSCMQSKAQRKAQESMARPCPKGTGSMWWRQFADVWSQCSSPVAGSCTHAAAKKWGAGSHGGGTSTEIGHLPTAAFLRVKCVPANYQTIKVFGKHCFRLSFYPVNCTPSLSGRPNIKLEAQDIVLLLGSY